MKRKRMKKEYNLKKLKKRPGKIKVDPSATKVPVSMRLDAAVIVEIKTQAEHLGIPYQTLISSILHRYANGDLVDLKLVNIDEIIKKGA